MPASYGGSSGGASLPDTPANVLLDVANAGEAVVLAPATGVGTSMGLDALVSTGVGALTWSADEGDFPVGDGAGGTQLASVDTAAVRAVLGVSGSTTLYADSFVAVPASETAAISGTGSTSTITLSASSTARTYGSAGVTAPRAILTLPAGTRTVEAEVQVSEVTGTSTSGFRYLTVAIQNVAAGTPTALWGVSSPDTGALYAGKLLAGGNSGSNLATPVVVAAAANRWMRATFALTEARLGVLVGSGSAGARPATWAPTSSAALPSGTAYDTIPDTAGQLYLVVVYQSFGNGGANTITVRVTVRATT